MAPFRHTSGQQALADVTSFRPNAIQCLRMCSLSWDHLFTFLLKELQPLWQPPGIVLNKSWRVVKFFLADLESECHPNCSLLILKPICAAPAIKGMDWISPWMRNRVVHQNTFINSNVRMKELFYGFSWYYKTTPLRVAPFFAPHRTPNGQRADVQVKNYKGSTSPKGWGAAHEAQHTAVQSRRAAPCIHSQTNHKPQLRLLILRGFDLLFQLSRLQDLQSILHLAK